VGGRSVGGRKWSQEVGMYVRGKARGKEMED
jgi:hypothetical protein